MVWPTKPFNIKKNHKKRINIENLLLFTENDFRRISSVRKNKKVFKIKIEV